MLSEVPEDDLRAVEQLYWSKVEGVSTNSVFPQFHLTLIAPILGQDHTTVYYGSDIEVATHGR